MTTRVLYVAGTGRSGSTLVAQLLERRTRGVHAGELRYLWERGIRDNHLCECGRPFDRCDFWTAVLDAAYGADVAGVSERIGRIATRIDRMRRVPQALTDVGPAYRADVARFAELVTPLYEQLAAVSGRDLVIDSSKDPSYLCTLAGVPALDLRTLHLLRDPRAVAYSWTRQRRRPEIHWEVQYMRTIAPRRAARNWLLYNVAIEAFARRYGKTARLRYEDFAAGPDDAVEAACRALELDARDPAEAIDGHSLSGNPMRFATGPLVVRPDVEWRTALPSRDRRTVTAITLPLLRRYGYPVRNTPSPPEESQCA